MREIAFVPVHGNALEPSSSEPWGLALAERNAAGYRPVPGFSFVKAKDAENAADQLNAALGHSPEQATSIVISSMRLGKPKRRS